MNSPLNAAFDADNNAIRTSGSATSIVPGTGATNLGKAEDAVHTSGDVGVMSLSVANEAQSTLAADGDYIPRGADTKGNTLVTGTVASGGTDSGNPIKIGGKYNSTLPTYTDGQRAEQQYGTRGSANATLYPANSNTPFIAVTNGTNSTGGNIFSAGILAQLDDTSPTAITENQFGNLRMSARRALLTKDEEKNSLTYSASASITLAGSATDFFTITGNASTTVNITKIRISGVQTTAGLVAVSLVKRSTADTSGTSSAVAAIPHDSSDAAASATLLAYTANPTTGTAVGTIRNDNVPFAGATASTNGVVEWTFGSNGRPVVLRGTSQVLALNLAGATVTGGVANVDIEWFEY